MLGVDPHQKAHVTPLKGGTLDARDRRFENVCLVILKVTHRCNLDCAYCYENIVNSGSDMSFEVLRLAVSRVLKNSNQGRVKFILHGGEPSLMKAEWLTETVKFIETEARVFGKRVDMGMQSNILALTDAKLSLLKKLNIQLSASLDGPSEIDSPMRGLAARAEANYLRAVDMGLRVGVLMTINNANWNKFRSICEWLDRKLNVTSFKANPITPVGAGRNLKPLSSDQVFSAYRDILDYMCASNGRLVEHNMRLEMKRFFSDRRSALSTTNCCERKCGAGSSVIGVNTNGTIFPCGRFEWSDADFALGDLHELASPELTRAYQGQVEKFLGLQPQTWADCGSCSARKICSYGCQAFIVRSRDKINIDCIPTKMRYEHMLRSKPKLESLMRTLLDDRP